MVGLCVCGLSNFGRVWGGRLPGVVEPPGFRLAQGEILAPRNLNFEYFDPWYRHPTSLRKPHNSSPPCLKMSMERWRKLHGRRLDHGETSQKKQLEKATRVRERTEINRSAREIISEETPWEDPVEETDQGPKNAMSNHQHPTNHPARPSHNIF